MSRRHQKIFMFNQRRSVKILHMRSEKEAIAELYFLLCKQCHNTTVIGTTQEEVLPALEKSDLAYLCSGQIYFSQLN